MENPRVVLWNTLCHAEEFDLYPNCLSEHVV